MYTVAVQRELIARHALVGRDFGPEGRPHSHRYLVEVRLTGDRLDRFGFLVDIDELTTRMEEVLGGFRDRLLNELPEFAGVNPSIEHLSRILCRAFRERLQMAPAADMTVTIRESESAWAAYADRDGCASAS
jgi:6-pyruvoyltetrahydropterin/6-carboxytetrahydropterin synthase